MLLCKLIILLCALVFFEYESKYDKVDVKNGENIFVDLLNTLSVSFVKYNSFTVLPYPLKYLNEYINMININS